MKLDNMVAGCVKRNMELSYENCGEISHFMLACSEERIVCGKCGVSGHWTEICKVGA